MALEEGKYNYTIDIDGTICEDIDNNNPEGMINAKVYPNAVEEINRLYDKGHIITFFTARTSKDHKDITTEWLQSNGFKYHSLLMDKPRFGNYRWIDNHSVEGIHFNTSNSEKEWSRMRYVLDPPDPAFEMIQIKDKILVLPMDYDRIDGLIKYIEKRVKNFSKGNIIIDLLLCNGHVTNRFCEFEVDHGISKILWNTGSVITDTIDIDINYYANRHYSYHLDLVKNSPFIYEHDNIEQFLTGKSND